VNIESRKAVLGLAMVGLLSYPACTAEKTTMKNSDLSAAPAAKTDPPQAQATPVAPKVVDGVFASCDQLQPVYFELNQSRLSDAAMEIAKSNAEWLKNQPPFLVRIVGYADSRGSTKKNDRLAERRALAVRDAYVALGLSKDRFSLASRGAETPLCTPTTEDCLSKSRRSETLIEEKALASS
jgi:outer membrane protein OmpA-like peptidoglycan-associated protein